MGNGVFDIFGDWTWWIIAVALLIIEMLVPAVVLLWFGLGALATGVVHVVIGPGWHVEVIVFAVLSVVMLVFFRPVVVRKRQSSGAQPHLNQRLDKLINRETVLIEAIKNGQGRVDLGGSLWLVKGPDMAKGARVRIVGHQDMVLDVEAIEN